jgi:hypothetical protein
MPLTGSRIPFSHAFFGAYRYAITVGFIREGVDLDQLLTDLRSISSTSPIQITARTKTI